MYCEWPEIRRCCICFPLRRGVLVLAYMNIIFSIIETVMYFSEMAEISIHRAYSQLPFELNIALFMLDAIATLVLVVGLHMKHELLVTIYFKFMIVFLSASVPLTIIDISLMKYGHSRFFAVFYFIFTSTMNIYLLMMVHSMVRKLQVSEGNTFGNRLADFIEGAPSEPENNTVIALPDENAPSITTY